MLTRLLRFLGLERQQLPAPSILVLALGNIGSRYEGTRHNVGFAVARRIIDQSQILAEKQQCASDVSLVKLASGRILAVARPVTLMNRSGQAAAALLRRYRKRPEELLVVVDDFNLPLGKLRIRKKGSHGGHNGLKSIMEAVGDTFPRLRVGIGPLPQGVDIISYVLGPFDAEEQEALEPVLDRASEAVRFFCENDVTAAMNAYNG
jgi:PTH1 family peptidyl-tRNA hydrolase